MLNIKNREDVDNYMKEFRHDIDVLKRAKS